jgi:alkylation response protein AidB-like acyl-CoA dehydrogenase
MTSRDDDVDHVNVQLSSIIYGSLAKVKSRRSMLSRIRADPVLYTPNYFDRSRQQCQADTMAKIRRVAELARKMESDSDVERSDLRELLSVLSEYDRSFAMRHGTHALLFREAVRLQGSEMQWRRWRRKIERYEVIGCFAMTELGHSSALRRLETVATYCERDQSFRLETPTLLATKFWIGGAGHTATHAVVICQLVVGGQPCGLGWLLVQIRDARGNAVDGVECGELGPKAGRHGVDNGWIRFDDVRVPRDNLLQRWMRVTDDGQFEPPAHAALPYLSLIPERHALIRDFCQMAQNGVTIACRYSVLRRQGDAPGGGGGERQIIDYQSHYCALMPIVAHAYAYQCAIAAEERRWAALAERSGGSGAGAAADMLAHVPAVHAASCGLKAWIGWWAADSLERCRRAMGGHAYSSFNAIDSLAADIHVLTTGGGDNAALVSQHARFLARRQGGGGDLDRRAAATTVVRLSYDDDDVDALEHLGHVLLGRTVASMRASQQRTDDTWNDHLNELIECSSVATDVLVCRSFAASIAERQAELGDRTNALLLAMRRLVVASSIGRHSLALLECKLIDGGATSTRRARADIIDQCAELKQSALVLTDGFDLPDFVLKSPLACRNQANAYQAYFDTVRNAPSTSNRAPYFDEHIAPLLSKL